MSIKATNSWFSAVSQEWLGSPMTSDQWAAFLSSDDVKKLNANEATTTPITITTKIRRTVAIIPACERFCELFLFFILIN